MDTKKHGTPKSLEILKFVCLRKKCVKQGCDITELYPSEEFELTANSLRAHIETRGRIILRTLRKLTVNSQDDSYCELAASFP